MRFNMVTALMGYRGSDATTLKIRAFFYAAWESILHSGGLCPAFLFDFWVNLAEIWKLDYQEVEGSASILKAMTKASPGMSWPLLSARLTNKKSVGRPSKDDRDALPGHSPVDRLAMQCEDVHDLAKQKHTLPGWDVDVQKYAAPAQTNPSKTSSASQRWAVTSARTLMAATSALGLAGPSAEHAVGMRLVRVSDGDMTEALKFPESICKWMHFLISLIHQKRFWAVAGSVRQNDENRIFMLTL